MYVWYGVHFVSEQTTIIRLLNRSIYYIIISLPSVCYVYIFNQNHIICTLEKIIIEYNNLMDNVTIIQI